MTNTDNPISRACARWLSKPTTDVGPATPPAAWCLPGTEPRWERLTAGYGGGSVCTWSRSFPDEPGAVGRGRRPHSRRPGSTQRAAELLNAADTLDKLTA
jgi:hypothetical protein